MKLLFILSVFLSSSTWALECSFKSEEGLGREVLQEINRHPIQCNNQSVHLTFDDGPLSTVTPVLLRELSQRNVKATFFVTTTNLDSSHRNHVENRTLVQQTLSAGHLIASHGHEHKAYDLRLNGSGEVLERGLTQSQREAQVNRSVALLNEATQNRFSRQTHLLFRLPYGRGAMPSAAELNYMDQRGLVVLQAQDYAGRLAEYRSQSPALQTISGPGFSHLGWNHDSGDSSYGRGMPERSVLKEYVLKNLKTMCQARSSQVALFHDIKVMNTAAIPVILDIGKCLGLNFVSANQIMEERESLTRRGVLIGRQAIQRAPVQNLEGLLRSLGSVGSAEPVCPAEEEKGCYSQQYNRRYRECEGGDSICLGARWYSRRDPVVIMNCNLKD